MKKITNAILVLSILFTLSLILYAGNPFSSEWWNGVFEFFGLAFLPYVILLFFNNIYQGVFKKDLALLVTTAITSGFAAVMLIDAFFIHIDAQSGLIFLFLPVYQSIAAILGGLIGLCLHQKSLNAQQKNGADHKNRAGFG